MTSIDNKNQGYRAVALTTGGAVAGAGAGLTVATIRNAATSKKYKSLAPLAKDTVAFSKAETSFVSDAVKSAKEAGKIKAKDTASLKNVKDEAIKTFKKLVNGAPAKMEAVKNSKIKWAAGLAAAGLLIGTAAALIISKKPAEEPAQSEKTVG